MTFAWRSLVFITLLFGIMSHTAFGASYHTEEKVIYQPELDNAISLEKYVKDGTLFNLLIQCLLFDGPCDPVGKWMRPRMASYYLESCPLCTKNQDQEVKNFIGWLYRAYPQLFNKGVQKYLEANGISLPLGSRFRNQVNAMNVPKVVTSSKEGTSSEESDGHSVSSGPSKSSRIDPEEESLHENLKTSDNEDSVMTTPVKILTTNSRRNKFGSDSSYSVQKQTRRKPSSGSSGTTSLFGHPQRVSHTALPEEVEDDEAESDFEITTVP